MDYRITACDLVMVGWHDGIGKLNQLGNVEDLSLGGMGILVYDDLPVGTPITVTYCYGELGGIVKHSTARNHWVFIGIDSINSAETQCSTSSLSC